MLSHEWPNKDWGYAFFQAILESFTEQVAVINSTGLIEYVNRAWIQFGLSNGYPKDASWLGVNYLAVCDKAADMGDATSATAARGIRKTMQGQDHQFYLEYPCHSPQEKRWFLMRVSRLDWDGPTYYLISHHNITERVLAEERVLELSLTDELTELANRRSFNSFLNLEWRRCARNQQALSLMLIDVDHFKHYNDTYGHPKGDACLRQVAKVIRSFAGRSGDLAARYGGEEFALVLGNTSSEAALHIAEQIVQAVQELNIPHARSGVAPMVTVSIGVANMVPIYGTSEQTLIHKADQMLYSAKQQGRNQALFKTAPRSH